MKPSLKDYYKVYIPKDNRIQTKGWTKYLRIGINI